MSNHSFYSPGCRYDAAWNDLPTKLRCAALNKRILPWLDTLLRHWLPDGCWSYRVIDCFCANDPQFPRNPMHLIHVKRDGSWHIGKSWLDRGPISGSTVVELAAYLHDSSAADAIAMIESLLQSVKHRRSPKQTGPIK